MLQLIDNGSITSVNGIKAAGINCGIKKQKKDLALIFSEVPCNVAGTFTLNKVIAAPLVVSKNLIKQQNKVKAVLVNSGNANACTGTIGFSNALDTQSCCAKQLSINPSEVIVSSTGVIGKQLPMELLKSGIGEIVNHLSESGGLDAAEAILTTDLKKKAFAVKAKLSGGLVTIGGICKGSGMIMPNMATMLAFLATDASIEQPVLQKLLSSSVNDSFNKVSVDGETSTNDMVILMENGLSEISVKENTEDYNIFSSALLAICQEMAKAIAADGEGATKLITISINNAKTKKDADTIARAVANSPLFKTAMNGNDANWGRILSVAGNSGVDFTPEKVSIKFDDMTILEPNYSVNFNEEEAKKLLNKENVKVSVDLDEGDQSSTWWTCDYSEGYIKINSSYRT
ncbi:MAG: bifunctional glutamate N-acetyltransferase/amino-acid acetyltransferase ArgJ [Ignavibacteriaceae bacterium]